MEIDRHALRELRKLGGHSAKSLAEAVGCSGAYISILENREDRACSPEVFARICDTLGIKDRSLLLRKADANEAA